MPKLTPFSASPLSPQESSLRLPANKRLAAPNSHRLNTITDPEASTSRNTQPPSTVNGINSANDAAGAGETASSTPRQRSLASIRLAPPLPRRASGSSSKISHPAPPYDWEPEPIEESLDGRVPVEGEKLRQLRDDDDEGKTVLWWRRKRAALLAIAIVLVVALAIGLGVGLSRRGQDASTKAAGAGNRTETSVEFPLGQWTVGAVLVQVNTACTSNSDAWRCYPYTVGGETIFDLTITNSSALYGPNSTARADAALQANLTISSSNAFAIRFSNQSMTYIAPAENATAARLEWSFDMAKKVIPDSDMMAAGEATECTFPGTVLTGTFYLNAARRDSEGTVSEDEWPYAVEIRQSKESNGEAIDCQGMRGGSVSVWGADGICDCVYRNY